MEKVSVYFFKGWDADAGVNVTSKRLATLQAIRGSKGEPMLETQRTVDRGYLDSNGFYPKTGVWLVEIFDLVYRHDRVSVPLGEYTMTPISPQTFSFSGALLPLPFALDRLDVEFYLLGRMKLIAGEPFC